MSARIFKLAKNAMQSGKSHIKPWVLEYEPKCPGGIDPLMGWVTATDVNRYVRLRFESKEQAVAYAERNSIECSIFNSKPKKIVKKSYADNFRYDKLESWTH
ncbi:MAG: ETC complex I subunit [Hyphomicrobiaceae bacterium]|nr:ETC complex I subunit [Hyphomicrobiaceae bacterium]